MTATAASLLCCCGSPNDCSTAFEFCGFENYPRMRVSFSYQVDFDTKILDQNGIRSFFQGDFSISGTVYFRRLYTSTLMYTLDNAIPFQQRLASVESRGSRSFPGGFASWDFTGAFLMSGFITCTSTNPWFQGGGFGTDCPPGPLTPYRQRFAVGLEGFDFNTDSQYALQGTTRWQQGDGPIRQCHGFVLGGGIRLGGSREHDPACPVPFRCIGRTPPGEPFFGGCPGYPGTLLGKARGTPYARCDDEEEESQGDPIFVGGRSEIDPELGGAYYAPGETLPTIIDPPTYCMEHHTIQHTRDLYHFIPPGSFGPSPPYSPFFFTNGSKSTVISVEALTY